MRNIVILGAGFGGLRASLKLAKKLKNYSDYRVILIDKNSYQTYTPSLYEVATAYRGGELKDSSGEQEFKEELAGSSCFVIRDIIEGKDIDFVQDEVVDIKIQVKSIILKSGIAINYEYCVVAVGSEVAHYNIEGAGACCGSLKTLRDALEIRFAVNILLQKHYKNNEDLRFVTIGAGLSGFEVTTELASYVEKLCKSYDSIDKPKIEIVLVDASPDILSGVPSNFRKLAVKRLKKLKIKTRTNSRIIRAEPHQVTFEDGSVMSASFILWGGGVRGSGLFKKINGLFLNKSGRIVVNKHLQAKGTDDIFAIGDGAYFFDTDQDSDIPATAWIAKQEADIASKNIYNSIFNKPFVKYKPKHLGFVSAAGGKYGIAYLFGFTVWGFSAWVIKRFIDLKYILSIYSFGQGIKIWFGELDLWTRND